MRGVVLAFLAAAGCASEARPTTSRLELRVRRAIAAHAPEARPSVWLAAADGRELLAIDADRPVPGASTLKVLILVEAHAQAIEGTFRFSDSVVLLEEDVVGGTGSLGRERPGSAWTYAQLARKMIAESDNTASNLLVRRLGMERINARARALGLAVTRLERFFMDFAARREGRENWTTAREMGRLLGAILRREILTPEACDAMIRALEATSRGRIAAGVPRNVPVGHKSGSLPGGRHDVGWVRLPGRPYLLCIFLENVLERPGGDGDGGVEAIEAAAQAVYEELGPSDE
jgi:beta-lactamase class A